MVLGNLGPVEHAVIIFTELRKHVDDKVGSKIRTRAREGLELIRASGLVPTLSFYYAKARDALTGVNDEESMAYMLYLKTILLYLESIGLIKGARKVFELQEELRELTQKERQGGDVKEEEKEKVRALLVENFINILNEVLQKSYIASNMLEPFLIEFKRLCEATWERER